MEKEIEELRKQLEQERTLKEMYLTYYKAKHSDIKGEFFRYRKALAEIKEIAGLFCNACQEFEPEKKGSNCMFCNHGNILQIISEVEDDRQN